MLNCFTTETSANLIAIKPLMKTTFSSWLTKQDTELQQWIGANRFTAEPGTSCIVPNRAGQLVCVLVGIATVDDFWVFGDLPLRLPAGKYTIVLDDPIWPKPEQWQRALIAWGLGSYIFSRYQKQAQKNALTRPQLQIPEAVNVDLCQAWVESIYWVRDLINTPTADMMPENLSDIAKQFADDTNSQFSVLMGDELLTANYPTIYAVGKGSSSSPRLIDLRWGAKTNPLVTLVGKGVCFDSGGLNLKSADGMRMMKKDMAGAAHVLGLARMIISQKLPIHLRVLIPAVENMVSGDSYHPGDVITTRKGITVEVSNTDAEGRLVLCDALAAAVEESPDLLIDFSTLTGAARVALGPDVAVFFTNHETVAAGLSQAADKNYDPIWRLPLYQPYERYLKSDVADICNASNGPYAGAITAALYLKSFVPAIIPWVHFDMSAWNFDKLPGRPAGGEACALRAVFAYLQGRYQ
jgi:leucyl aminopeptidase